LIECVIFDCDGTLVDSEVLFNQALSVKLAERGVGLSAEQLVVRFRGVQLTKVLQTLSQEYDVELDTHFVDGYRVLVTEYFKRDLIACQGVPQILAKLDQALCVASNGPLAKMKMALELTNIDHYFNGHLFSAYQINSWKPAPNLFLHAAKTMGYSSKQCMVVEDSVVGIQAAIAAGMSAVLYDPNGVHPSIDGVIKISKFSQILELLDA